MSSVNSMSNPVAEREALGISAQTPLVQGDIVSGRVVEVVAQQSIQNASGKWVALVADGKPYEFGNDLAAQQRALVVFGDISGSVAKGHIVQAKVKERGGALVVQQLNNLTTHSSIQPAAQANGTTILVVGAVLLLALAFIAWQAFGFVASGGLVSALVGLIRSLFDAFGPALFSIGLLFLLVRSFVK